MTSGHVRIDEGTGAAREGALFSQTSVDRSARNLGGQVHAVRWTARLGCPDGAETAESHEYDRIVKALGSGRWRLGKHRSRPVRITLEGRQPVSLSEARACRIVLRTAALMVRGEALTDEDAYHTELSDDWASVGDGFTLLRDAAGAPDFFAALELRGGCAMTQDRLFGHTAVAPFVLVKPGSVFHLVPKNAATAPEQLKTWTRTGLPVPGWGEDLAIGRGPLWTRCPCRPGNGYGAITVEVLT